MKNKESTDPVPFLRGCEQPLFHAAADEIERLRARQKWIACSDEMPDVDMMVLTFAPSSSEPVWPAAFAGKLWVDDYGMELAPPVTHWMMFPDPPEVVTE